MVVLRAPESAERVRDEGELRIGVVVSGADESVGEGGSPVDLEFCFRVFALAS